MSRDFAVQVLGGVARVTFDDSVSDAVARRMRRQWRHLIVDDTAAAAPGESFTVTLERSASLGAGGSRRVYASDADHLPDALASRLTRAALQRLVGRLFLFHAAGLAAPDGRMMALVGPSGRGKTTASLALGRTLGYVTDETVAFDLDRSVTAYPKPLSIGRRPGVKELSAPDEVGLTPFPGRARLAAFVLLDRREEPTPARVEQVDLWDALPDLVGQTSSLARLPRPLQALAEVVAATGGVRRVVYSEAADLVALVDEVWTAARSVSAARAVEVVEPESSRGVRRTAFVDAVDCGDGIAVLGEDRLHLLAGAGAAVWVAASGVDDATLAARVRAVLGDPPEGVDVDRVVEDAVAGLVSAGLVERL